MTEREQKSNISAGNKIPFTPDQQRAIFEPGDIIVSAGAGSGKTAVMIARIIEKLKSGDATLDQMLIVTFTRAAASDMKFKLAEKLADLRRDQKYKRIAESAIESMPSCNISTLHSFCQTIIKRYFFVADLDPSAVVSDEDVAASLLRDAVAAATEKALADGNEDFAVMYDMLSTRRGDADMRETLKTILDTALSLPDPEGYLRAERSDESFFAELDGAIGKRANALYERIDGLKRELSAAGMTKHVAAISEFKDYMLGRIDSVTRTSHTSRFDETDELNESFKTLKKQCKTFAELYAEAQCAKAYRGDRYAKALCDVALDALARYGERKARLGIIDYSDMEHGAFRVLKDSDCLKEISRGIRYVFIDEFQDVNPMQSEIAGLLRGAVKETFVVGDVKQSIYGFRRCSPEHFVNAVNSGHYKHISLTDNFRSSAPVIDFVNRVFDGVMTEDFGGVNYADAEQRLVCGSGKTDGGAYYVVLPSDEKDDTDGDTENDDADGDEGGYSVKNAAASAKHNKEAVFVAKTVCKILKSANPPELSKIAVLLRSYRGFGSAVVNELTSRNVKVGLDKKSRAKSFPEVVGLVDILRCVDNRYDDVALYTALRSPMGGFSDAEILDIAQGGGTELIGRAASPKLGDGKRYTLWEKLCAYRGDLAERVKNFTEFRDGFAEFAKSHDCADTLGEITSAIDYFQYVYECGCSAQAIDALIEYAADRCCDTHAFLEYYDKIDFGIDTNAGGDAVTVATEHSSKGLEYDYVIVAGTNRTFNERDKSKNVIVSARGVFVKVPDASEGKIVKTAPWLAENLRMPDETRAEELRLFYVALTRAKKCLIVCGEKEKRVPELVRDSNCPGGFMRNILPTPYDPSSLPDDGMGEKSTDEPVDAEITNAVRRRIEYAEAYNAARKKSMSVRGRDDTDILAPIKTCVTSVARDCEEGDYTVTAPVLTVDVPESGDALLRGTAYHRAMELIDFASPDFNVVERECENCALVDADIVLRAAADMDKLARGATLVAKERYFIVDLPLEKVYGAGEGNVLVQGVIDLLILYPDGTAVIVDYKTGDPRMFDYAAYARQLELYGAAVERTTGYRVRAAYLYALFAGKLLAYPSFDVV